MYLFLPLSFVVEGSGRAGAAHAEGQRRRRAVVRCTCRRTGRRHFQGGAESFKCTLTKGRTVHTRAARSRRRRRRRAL